MGGLVYIILLGLVIGVLSKLIMPGSVPSGWDRPLVLGHWSRGGGGVPWLARRFGDVTGFNIRSIVLGVIGSAVVLWLGRKSRGDEIGTFAPRGIEWFTEENSIMKMRPHGCFRDASSFGSSPASCHSTRSRRFPRRMPRCGWTSPPRIRGRVERGGRKRFGPVAIGGLHGGGRAPVSPWCWNQTSTRRGWKKTPARAAGVPGPVRGVPRTGLSSCASPLPKRETPPVSRPFGGSAVNRPGTCIGRDGGAAP